MTIKVCIRDRIERSNPNGGIGAVIHAQHKYLPNYDIEVVPEPEGADVFAGHTQQFEFPIDHYAPPFILHSHGMYWTGDEGSYGNFATKANQSIAESIRRADYISVTADWVGEYVRRDLRREPYVIGHGIEPDLWKPEQNEGYVFWAKSRAFDSCNPIWPYLIAERGIKVISTFMPQDKPRLEKNMMVTGFLEPAIMKDRMQHADIYLATTLETFGITTLEAMASGVPVLGFNWGGTKDIVRHKIDGYLARPNDIEDLLAGYSFIQQNRAGLSKNARERVREFTWDKVMQKYADLYHLAYEERKQKKSGVSVIVTNFNYRKYVGEAIESIFKQTYPVDEIIVVDDGSTDGSQEYLKEHYNASKNVILLLQENQGVASARNNGITRATQPFVMCLDADDKLETTYVEVCRKKLLQDKGTGVVYTGLVYFNDEQPIDKTKVQITPFDFYTQMRGGIPPATCIPCAAMFRKDMWSRAGGYKQRYAPAEDTEFWVRGIVNGYTVEVASKEGLFLYRGHQGSASRTKRYGAIDDNKPYMRDRNYPFAAPCPKMPLVRSYVQPSVTIGIEVKAGQEYNVREVIDSVLGLIIRDWELILFGERVDPEIAKLYPFVKYNTEPISDLWFKFDAGHLLQPDALQQLAVAIINNLLPSPAYIFRNPTGDEDMSNCCGGNGNQVLNAKRMLNMIPPEPQSPIDSQGRIKMMFIGERKGPVGYTPPKDNPGGRDTYFGANTDSHRFVMARPEHVQWLEQTSVWKRAPKSEMDTLMVDQGKPMYQVQE